MTGVIISNGSVRDYNYYRKYFEAAKLIICADGGASHLRKFSILPHVLIGDLDSIGKDDLQYFIDNGVEIMRFPAEKDMTDTELAVDIAIDKGCKTIIFIGALGTRLDHSLSNVFMLRSMLDKGIKGIIADEHNEITIINDGIVLQKEENINVSLLPLTDRVEGVSTKGLYYPLHNAEISMGSSWGVSNEFVDEVAEVTIKKGIMLVVKSRD